MRIIMTYYNDILDINDKQMVENFEKELYTAFYNRNPDTFIKGNYVLTGDFKIKPPFEYKDLLTIVTISNNSIITSSCLNLDVLNETQLEKVGFDFHEKKNLGVCEVLFMFQTENHNFNPFELGISQNKYWKEKLITEGIKEIYGSCQKKY